MKDSELASLDCDTTNSITINNCSVGDVCTHSFYSNLAIDNVYITNSSISDLKLVGKDIVHIENSYIDRLAEGVIIYSGSLTLNSGGFSGTEDYMNSTVLANTNILISRFLGNIEINGTAQLAIQDYAYNHDILCLDKAELIGKNSTIDNIVSRDSTTVNVENCSIYEEISLFDDTILYITQSGYIDGIIAMGNSFASIEDANIYLLYAFEPTRVTIDNSILVGIFVFASNTIDYALKAYNSITTYLSTFTWGS